MYLLLETSTFEIGVPSLKDLSSELGIARFALELLAVLVGHGLDLRESVRDPDLISPEEIDGRCQLGDRLYTRGRTSKAYLDVTRLLQQSLVKRSSPLSLTLLELKVDPSLPEDLWHVEFL
jgi:hypothetical protein